MYRLGFEKRELHEAIGGDRGPIQLVRDSMQRIRHDALLPGVNLDVAVHENPAIVENLHRRPFTIKPESLPADRLRLSEEEKTVAIGL